MKKIPVISEIYSSTKQLVEAFSFNNKQLMDCVLVEFPRAGAWSIGFITNTEVQCLIDKEGKDFSQEKISVFVPTTPNPTTGFFMFIDRKETIPLAMSADEAAKLIMSAGVLSPNILKIKKKINKKHNKPKENETFS